MFKINKYFKPYLYFIILIFILVLTSCSKTESANISSDSDYKYDLNGPQLVYGYKSRAGVIKDIKKIGEYTKKIDFLNGKIQINDYIEYEIEVTFELITGEAFTCEFSRESRYSIAAGYDENQLVAYHWDRPMTVKELYTLWNGKEINAHFAFHHCLGILKEDATYDKDFTPEISLQTFDFVCIDDEEISDANLIINNYI